MCLQGVTPFGAVGTDETKVFKALASYKGTLDYTSRTPDAVRYADLWIITVFLLHFY